jgi:hypothetical protein
MIEHRAVIACIEIAAAVRPADWSGRWPVFWPCCHKQCAETRAVSGAIPFMPPKTPGHTCVNDVPISVISQEFCQRYLSNPKDPNAFEAGESLQVNGVADRHGPSIDGYNVRYCFCWGLALSPCIAGQEALQANHSPETLHGAPSPAASLIAVVDKKPIAKSMPRSRTQGHRAGQVAASELPDASA